MSLSNTEILQKIVILEEKLAHQEYITEKLNQIVIDQQQQIEFLDKLQHSLQQKLAELAIDDKIKTNDLPPHY